ncbi:hypothetical protein ACTMTI_30165 [Nonomuraea sp. H19]|uniref:hypothetical protein n=1 Tax=Nonomuraea sp. H19 TaxID=3452206 RepID=UPI003F8B58E8
MSVDLHAWTLEFARRTPECLPPATFFPEPGVVDYVRRAHEAGAKIAHRTARYSFAGPGREVVTEIEALFRFEDDLIVHHHDEFGFRRWSKMAHGRLSGWTPMWRKTIRDRAAQQLDQLGSA